MKKGLFDNPISLEYASRNGLKIDLKKVSINISIAQFENATLYIYNLFGKDLPPLRVLFVHSRIVIISIEHTVTSFPVILTYWVSINQDCVNKIIKYTNGYY